MGYWKPSYDDFYYVIDELFDVRRRTWTDHIEDKENYNAGNCFKHQKDAEESVKREKKARFKYQQELKFGIQGESEGT